MKKIVCTVHVSYFEVKDQNGNRYSMWPMAHSLRTPASEIKCFCCLEVDMRWNWTRKKHYHSGGKWSSRRGVLEGIQYFA